MSEREQILYRVAPNRRVGADCHNWCSILDAEGRVRIIVCFSRGVIDPTRFAAYLDECRDNSHTMMSAVGCSMGMATVSSEQRKLIPTALKGKRLAIVADNIMTRGLATALNWLGMRIKSFSWEQLDDAVHYLRVEGLDDAVLREAITQLRDRSCAVEGSAADPPAP